MGKKIKAQEVAYRYIKEQIDSGHFETGVKLIEQNISNDLEISRTPIREAISRLVEERYLIRIKNKGVVVHKQKISNKEFIEMTQLLEILLSHYLFQLQIKNETLLGTEILVPLGQLEFSTKLNERQKLMQLFLMKYLEKLDNQIMKQLIMKQFETIHYVDFPDASTHFLYDECCRSFKHMLQHINEKKYDFARKDVRILVNRLNLELIDQQI